MRALARGQPSGSVSFGSTCWLPPRGLVLGNGVRYIYSECSNSAENCPAAIDNTLQPSCILTITLSFRSVQFASFLLSALLLLLPIVRLNSRPNFYASSVCNEIWMMRIIWIISRKNREEEDTLNCGNYKFRMITRMIKCLIRGIKIKRSMFIMIVLRMLKEFLIYIISSSIFLISSLNVLIKCTTCFNCVT